MCGEKIDRFVCKSFPISYLQNSLALAFVECQSFQMYLTQQGKVTT